MLWCRVANDCLQHDTACDQVLHKLPRIDDTCVLSTLHVRGGNEDTGRGRAKTKVEKVWMVLLSKQHSNMTTLEDVLIVCAMNQGPWTRASGLMQDRDVNSPYHVLYCTSGTVCTEHLLYCTLQ